jgi:hypothetical protein
MSYKKYKQGVFKPRNANKYKGTTPIIYRSGMELTYMKWCDFNSNVIEWLSESTVIPYIKPTDGKLHRYFVDFSIKLKTNSGIQKYLVEIKPFRQTQQPKLAGKKTQSTLLYEQIQYAVNQAKWQACEAWCKSHNYKFLILTEKDLKTPQK